MRVLICDDEPFYAEKIQKLLQDYCTNYGIGADFLTVTNTNYLKDQQLAQVDIAFLDIDMVPVNGLIVAQKIREVRGDTIIIFVTNFIAYAPEGYLVQAFRYLMKMELEEKLCDYFNEAVKKFTQTHQVLTIQIEGEQIDLPVKQIIYIEAQQRMMKIYLQSNGRSQYQCYATMAAMENQLAPFGFLRIHKSYLVNMSQIKKLQQRGVELSNGETISISVRKYSEIRGKYLLWRGKNKWILS